MISAIKRRLSGLTDSVGRYPVTVVFLIAAAVMTGLMIHDGRDLVKMTLTCAVGAAALAAAQSAYERFFIGAIWRTTLFAAGLLVTALFYLSIFRLPTDTAETAVRAVVSIATLLIAYIWLGVVGSRIGFNDSFMAAFKALAQALFFSGVLFLGCAAIIAAVDLLILPVHENAYPYTADFVFIVFLPMLFLSLVPIYPGRGGTTEDRDTARQALVEKRTSCPRFLEVLLTYIVIPLAAVFTFILVIYIFMNIGGKFWTNDLLEPLLISYSITVLILTLLVGRLENKFATLFKMIFPKVLVLIALFQTVASVLQAADAGVTFSRYFVILFGVFSVFSGIVLSGWPVWKSGAIAACFLVLATISMVPPIDAFTVSRNSQIQVMTAVLEKNGMLTDGKIQPNGNIPEEDKARLTTALQYLASTNEITAVTYLPAGFSPYDDASFYNVFGFHFYEIDRPTEQYVSVSYDFSDMITVAGYDVVTQNVMSAPALTEKTGATNAAAFEVNSITYRMETNGSEMQLRLLDSNGKTLLVFDASTIRARFDKLTRYDNNLSLDEATFTTENDKAALKIVIQNAGFTRGQAANDFYAQMLVCINIK
ncbi:DUF4153 domain-containing protein [Oscillospiraceae bacterium CM]|nr:DUF4153 domain-containing protein [Oscillospiraceae bacterium CM]